MTEPRLLAPVFAAPPPRRPNNGVPRSREHHRHCGRNAKRRTAHKPRVGLGGPVPLALPQGSPRSSTWCPVSAVPPHTSRDRHTRPCPLRHRRQSAVSA
eukprot:CAMPEP_0180543326 /NCGR_PEP_ID=MMETSP1036_2-20121128/68922_1 /TAXON_ID=632150 /ORGANISM="Azadinium spinosum, Strain 3D9" /LENGTH=98 /DNA_ID=CAMNT_0022558245 /DNA_START=97 /DNA_END=389 /DNA_ORIENTATION=+